MAESRYAGAGEAAPTVTGTNKSESGNSTTNQTQTINESSQTSSSSYAQNMPQAALQALLDVIGQMSGVAKHTPEQAAAKTPLLIQVDSINGVQRWKDPLTGKIIYGDQREVAAFNQQRLAERQTLIEGRTAGTPEQQKAAQERDSEIQRNRSVQEKYSKEAALADAQNLTSYFARKMMEEAMPAISRGAEGSGTSQGTVRMLLAEQAAGRTAEAGATLGTQLATGYGQVNNQLASVLEALTRIDPNGPSALLIQALNVAKGSVQSSNSSSSSSGTKTINTSTDTTTNAEANSKNEYNGQLNNDILSNTRIEYGPFYNTPQVAVTPGTSYMGAIRNTTDNPDLPPQYDDYNYSSSDENYHIDP